MQYIQLARTHIYTLYRTFVKVYLQRVHSTGTYMQCEFYWRHPQTRPEESKVARGPSAAVATGQGSAMPPFGMSGWCLTQAWVDIKRTGEHLQNQILVTW